MNNQHKLYDERYEELLAILVSFLEKSLVGNNPVSEIRQITGYLIDSYTDAFLDEASYIIDELGIPLSEVEYRHLQNEVDTSEFARSNRNRITKILTDRVKDIRSLKVNQDELGLDDTQVVERAMNIILTIATAELHMAVEKASVQSSKLVMDISGLTLYKTWNSVLDENTCPICEGLHGTTIPVTNSFSNTEAGANYVEDLSYAGGEIAYGHPRCRCWITYSKA